MRQELGPIVIPEELRRVEVVCPMPGQEHHGSQAFEDFAATEFGAQFAADVVERLGEAEGLGMDREKAIGFVLGRAAIKDEHTGTLFRSEPETVKKNWLNKLKSW